MPIRAVQDVTTKWRKELLITQKPWPPQQLKSYHTRAEVVDELEKRMNLKVAPDVQHAFLHHCNARGRIVEERGAVLGVNSEYDPQKTYPFYIIADSDRCKPDGVMPAPLTVRDMALLLCRHALLYDLRRSDPKMIIATTDGLERLLTNDEISFISTFTINGKLEQAGTKRGNRNGTRKRPPKKRKNGRRQLARG